MNVEMCYRRRWTWKASRLLDNFDSIFGFKNDCIKYGGMLRKKGIIIEGTENIFTDK